MINVMEEFSNECLKDVWFVWLFENIDNNKLFLK